MYRKTCMLSLKSRTRLRDQFYCNIGMFFFRTHFENLRRLNVFWCLQNRRFFWNVKPFFFKPKQSINGPERISFNYSRFQKTQLPRSFYQLLGPSLVFVLVSGVFIAFNSKGIKKHFGKQGANILRETLQSKDLQLTALEVLRPLLQEILCDPDIMVYTSSWITHIMYASKDEFLFFLEQLCNSEFISNTLRELAYRLVDNLCSSDFVRKRFSLFLIQAINGSDVKNAAVAWVLEILRNEQVLKQLEYTVCENVLRNTSVEVQATQFAGDVVRHILGDPNILELSRKHVVQVLKNEAFQKFAGNAAWDVFKKALLPRWTVSSPNRFLLTQFDKYPYKTGSIPGQADHSLANETT